MKNIKFILLLQLVVSSVYAQDRSLSTFINSRFDNEEGIAQFVTFDETSKLNVDNRSDLLKEFFKTPEKTTFVKVNAKTDKIGILHETFQQYFNEVPVEFGIYKAHLKNGRLSAINGEYFPVQEINTIPDISEKDAVAMAKRHINAGSYYDQSMNALGYNGPEPTLVVFPKMKGINAVDRLAYKLDIYAEKPLYRADIYVDAHTGHIIFENNKIHQSNQPASGTTLHNGVQNFTAEHFRIGYRLRQTTHGDGIQTFNATNGVLNATDIISSSASFNSINDAAVQVHWGTEQAYDYYFQEHNRNSFDDNGALIKSYITPQTINANAYWTGDVLYYSAGNTQNIGPLTSLDIVGHEFTHAVGDYSANLIYSNQSGAIDESFADIFGEMVENFAQGSNDWLCGADVFSGGLRSMSDPKSKLHPDTYLGQYWQTTSNDNFGVHINSGVHNKWFYLLAAGGTGTNDNLYNYTVNGIGIQKAAEIAYRSLTLYLTPTSNYHYACEVSIYAAIQLFGPNSPEHIATVEAWKAVGLLMQPTDYISPTTPLNLVVTSATEYDVSLSWDASTDNVGVTGYTVLLDGSAVKTTANTNAAVSGLFLQHNIAYEFTVVAFDAAGNVSGTSNIEFVWFDTIDPTAPTNLISSNTTETTTDLNWTHSSDNFGYVDYKLYQDNALIATVDNTTNSYSVSGLNPATTYDYTVIAIDSSGNESNVSNTESVTTLAPCASGNVTLTIAFDWYPEEVSWDIRDANNVVVASDGNYPMSWVIPPPEVYTIALSSGYYTLNMYDTFGDGIWSPGGYVLESNVVIASGNETNPMANTVTTPFCIDTSLNRAASTNVIVSNSSTKPVTEIYPNPVLDLLHVKHADHKNKSYLIVDLTGKTVLKGLFDSENSIDVSRIQPGLYTLSITSEGETAYHKFIKK